MGGRDGRQLRQARRVLGSAKQRVITTGSACARAVCWCHYSTASSSTEGVTQGSMMATVERRQAAAATMKTRDYFCFLRQSLVASLSLPALTLSATQEDRLAARRRGARPPARLLLLGLPFFHDPSPRPCRPFHRGCSSHDCQPAFFSFDAGGDEPAASPIGAFPGPASCGSLASSRGRDSATARQASSLALLGVKECVVFVSPVSLPTLLKHLGTCSDRRLRGCRRKHFSTPLVCTSRPSRFHKACLTDHAGTGRSYMLGLCTCSLSRNRCGAASGELRRSSEKSLPTPRVCVGRGPSNLRPGRTTK